MSTTGLAQAVSTLVGILIEDEGFKALCKDAFHQLDVQKFERILRRLLRIYSRDLIRASANELEFSAGRFIKARVKYTVHSIHMNIDPQSVQRAEDLESLLGTKTEKKQLIEQFLRQCQSSEVHEITTEKGESDASSSDDQSDSTINQPAPTDLETVKRFMINGNPFEDLREGMMEFVVPNMLLIHKSLYPFELLDQQIITCGSKPPLIGVEALSEKGKWLGAQCQILEEESVIIKLHSGNLSPSSWRF